MPGFPSWSCSLNFVGRLEPKPRSLSGSPTSGCWSLKRIRLRKRSRKEERASRHASSKPGGQHRKLGSLATAFHWSLRSSSDSAAKERVRARAGGFCRFALETGDALKSDSSRKPRPVQASHTLEASGPMRPAPSRTSN